MFRQLLICGCLLAVLSVAQAGVIGGGLLGPAAVAVQPAAAATLPLPAAAVAVPSIATSTSNIIRGIDNLGSVSAFAKSEDTPFSSVRKADVRINNPDAIVAATAVTAPLTAAVAAPALLAPGLTTAYAAGPAITAAGLPLGLNGLALNGLGAVKII